MKKYNMLLRYNVYNDKILILYFNNGNIRLLDFDKISKSKNLSENKRKRWIFMYNDGKFTNPEIDKGDLVWPGLVEIFDEDIEKETIKIN